MLLCILGFKNYVILAYTRNRELRDIFLFNIWVFMAVGAGDLGQAAQQGVVRGIGYTRTHKIKE
jgi:Na+-driven multidrug efflux pump